MFSRRGAEHFTIVDADKFNVDIIKIRYMCLSNRFVQRYVHEYESIYNSAIIHKKTNNPIHVHTNWIDLGDTFELSSDTAGNIYLHIP